MHIILIVAWAILLAVALYWEFGDYGRMKKRTKVKDLPNAKEQLKDLRFLACFGYENTVRWRFIFIFSSIISLSVYMLLPKMIEVSSQSRMLITTVLFFLSFLTMYFGHAFRSFHFDRELCGKVRGEFQSF